ncbi:cytochrome P450 [Nemania sp. FL0031]|nr:cytochrome P450 [Nemania sp. FL0031]
MSTLYQRFPLRLGEATWLSYIMRPVLLRTVTYSCGLALGLRFWLNWTSPSRPILSSILVLCAGSLLKYAWDVHVYNRARGRQGLGQIPPTYPMPVPFLGALVAIFYDIHGFWRRATSFKGQLTSTRITILGFDVYLFQDRETVAKLMRHPRISSPMSRFIYALEYLFGMPKTGLSLYVADNSGPFAKPYPGTSVAPSDRINHITHQKWQQAWNGAHLDSTTRRFRVAIQNEIHNLPFTKDWAQVEDYFKLFGSLVSASMIEAVYGRSLLQLNPNFVRDLWKFDEALPSLARGVPSFIMPDAHRVRESLRTQIKVWYEFYRRNSPTLSTDTRKDGDRAWPSELVRELHVLFADRESFDDNALSAHDLGHIWAISSNSISSAMLCLYHIVRDPLLTRRVREEIAKNMDPGRSLLDLDMAQLVKFPLLSSIYAEVLRLYIEASVVLTPPLADAYLGMWRLQKDDIAIVNPSLSHRDVTFWNTKDGLYPVDSFWADRFLIYPLDPSSGPIRPEIRSDVVGKYPDNTSEKPIFSLDGLEGMWIPYGGGSSICPGRLVAKSLIMSTCALIVNEFDFEILPHSLELDPKRFGFGMARPRLPIALRIKRRAPT